MHRSFFVLLGAAALALSTTGEPAVARQAAPPAASVQVQTPQQFFGFRIGTDGELARYPKILDYFQHLAKTTQRLKYQELGKTTMGNPYVLATISAPENLAKLEKLIAINRRLADPRGLTEADAKRLAQEGRAFYFVYGTIHSTEVGNTQALTEIVHRLVDRHERRHQADPRQRRAAGRAVTESRRPGPRRRSLVQDEGNAVRARLSRPVSQVRRSRRQPRLVHVHAESRRGWRSRSSQRLQADHHARHAPARDDGIADLRAAVRRSLRSERASDSRRKA